MPAIVKKISSSTVVPLSAKVRPPRHTHFFQYRFHRNTNSAGGGRFYGQTVGQTILALITAVPAAAAEQGPNLQTVIKQIAISIFAAMMPLSIIIGIIVVGMGIKRFMDGNNGPSGGKGALTTITIGALVMLMKTTSLVFLITVRSALGSHPAAANVQAMIDIVRGTTGF